MVQRKIMVAPDGDWGWVVVFASALCNMIVVPIIQNFGLIYQDTFKSIGLSATDSTVIININSAFGMVLGLFNGQLMKTFGYRKVALCGSVMIVIGVISTAYATTFTAFIITYSLITSLGMALCMASFHLAINTYFKKRRNKAMGYAMTLTGLGPIIMPHLLTFLMALYGVQGTVLIFGAISMHSIMASLLLQPVKWHMKPEYTNVEESIGYEEEQVFDPENELPPDKNDNENDWKKSKTYIDASIEYDIDKASIYGMDGILPSRKNSVSPFTSEGIHRRRSVSSFSNDKDDDNPRRWWSSVSVNIIDPANNHKISTQGYHPMAVMNSKDLADESTKNSDKDPTKGPLPIPNGIKYENTKLISDSSTKSRKNEIEIAVDKPKKKNIFVRVLLSIVHFFDLDLLRDPVYTNLMLGMSFAIYAEINFSVLTPFILGDMFFTTKQIATVMSLIAGIDIVFRFISPYVGDWLKLSPKVMYMISMVLLICSRSCILFYTSYNALLVIAAFLGVAKGVRTVYIALVIPAHVPLERLASASGIQTVTNGIILLTLGPLLGIIRDWTGSYNKCIIFINFITGLTLAMWTIGAFVCRSKSNDIGSISKNVSAKL